MVRLLLVTGSGRSGTSSVAGTLKRLGGYVPQPEVPTDERNPRGYYEPLWIAQWHKEWLDALPVRTIDTRPHAGRIALDDLTPERETELRDWLAAELSAHADQRVVVIKETRAYWVFPMWERVARDVGADLSSLTMLRHPAQVVRSRDTAYLSHKDDEFRARRESANVAAWTNSLFETERVSREVPRSFVPYYDLIGDWRAAMRRVWDQLDLPADLLGDLAAPHPVDDFVSASLNRSGDSWEGLRVPAALRDLAEGSWTAAARLVQDPADAAARAELDGLRAAYVELYDTASALASDDATAEVRAVKDDFRRRLREKNRRIEELQAELAALRD